MAVFNRSFNDEEPKKKRAFFRYFEILYRKFTKIVMYNIAYFACILPLLCGIIFLICELFKVSPETVEALFFVRSALWVINFLPAPVFLMLLIASIVAYGPLTAGLTYVTRNISTETHSWFSDLFTRAKSNFKQGFILGILDLVVFSSFLLYISADFSLIAGSMKYLYQGLRIVAVIATLIYFCMRFYTYAIAVTFVLKLKDIFKNSLIFCVLGFFNNIVAILIIFIVAISFISTPRVDVVLISTVFFALCRFSVMFATYPIIKKYMLEPAKEAGDEKESG